MEKHGVKGKKIREKNESVNMRVWKRALLQCVRVCFSWGTKQEWTKMFFSFILIKNALEKKKQRKKRNIWEGMCREEHWKRIRKLYNHIYMCPFVKGVIVGLKLYEINSIKLKSNCWGMSWGRRKNVKRGRYNFQQLSRFFFLLA